MGDKIEGRTLSDEHNDAPDPPTSYGKPDARMIVENVGMFAWAWHTKNPDAYIDYTGKTVDVKQ